MAFANLHSDFEFDDDLDNDKTQPKKVAAGVSGGDLMKSDIFKGRYTSEELQEKAKTLMDHQTIAQRERLKANQNTIVSSKLKVLLSNAKGSEKTQNELAREQIINQGLQLLGDGRGLSNADASELSPRTLLNRKEKAQVLGREDKDWKLVIPLKSENEAGLVMNKAILDQAKTEFAVHYLVETNIPATNEAVQAVRERPTGIKDQGTVAKEKLRADIQERLKRTAQEKLDQLMVAKKTARSIAKKKGIGKYKQFDGANTDHISESENDSNIDNQKDKDKANQNQVKQGLASPQIGKFKKQKTFMEIEEDKQKKIKEREKREEINADKEIGIILQRNLDQLKSHTQTGAVIKRVLSQPKEVPEYDDDWRNKLYKQSQRRQNNQEMNTTQTSSQTPRFNQEVSNQSHIGADKLQSILKGDNKYKESAEDIKWKNIKTWKHSLNNLSHHIYSSTVSRLDDHWEYSVLMDKKKKEEEEKEKIELMRQLEQRAQEDRERSANEEREKLRLKRKQEDQFEYDEYGDDLMDEKQALEQEKQEKEKEKKERERREQERRDGIRSSNTNNTNNNNTSNNGQLFNNDNGQKGWLLRQRHVKPKTKVKSKVMQITNELIQKQQQWQDQIFQGGIMGENGTEQPEMSRYLKLSNEKQPKYLQDIIELQLKSKFDPDAVMKQLRQREQLKAVGVLSKTGGNIKDKKNQEQNKKDTQNGAQNKQQTVKNVKQLNKIDQNDPIDEEENENENEIQEEGTVEDQQNRLENKDNTSMNSNNNVSSISKSQTLPNLYMSTFIDKQINKSGTYNKQSVNKPNQHIKPVIMDNSNKNSIQSSNSISSIQTPTQQRSQSFSNKKKVSRLNIHDVTQPINTPISQNLSDQQFNKHISNNNTSQQQQNSTYGIWKKPQKDPHEIIVAERTKVSTKSDHLQTYYWHLAKPQNGSLQQSSSSSSISNSTSLQSLNMDQYKNNNSIIKLLSNQNQQKRKYGQLIGPMNLRKLWQLFKFPITPAILQRDGEKQRTQNENGQISGENTLNKQQKKKKKEKRKRQMNNKSVVDGFDINEDDQEEMIDYDVHLSYEESSSDEYEAIEGNQVQRDLQKNASQDPTLVLSKAQTPGDYLRFMLQRELKGKRVVKINTRTGRMSTDPIVFNWVEEVEKIFVYPYCLQQRRKMDMGLQQYRRKRERQREIALQQLQREEKRRLKELKEKEMKKRKQMMIEKKKKEIKDKFDEDDDQFYDGKRRKRSNSIRYSKDDEINIFQDNDDLFDNFEQYDDEEEDQGEEPFVEDETTVTFWYKKLTELSTAGASDDKQKEKEKEKEKEKDKKPDKSSTSANNTTNQDTPQQSESAAAAASAAAEREKDKERRKQWERDAALERERERLTLDEIRLIVPDPRTEEMAEYLQGFTRAFPFDSLAHRLHQEYIRTAVQLLNNEQFNRVVRLAVRLSYLLFVMPFFYPDQSEAQYFLTDPQKFHIQPIEEENENITPKTNNRQQSPSEIQNTNTTQSNSSDKQQKEQISVKDQYTIQAENSLNNSLNNPTIKVRGSYDPKRPSSGNQAYKNSPEFDIPQNSNSPNLQQFVSVSPPIRSSSPNIDNRNVRPISSTSYVDNINMNSSANQEKDSYFQLQILSQCGAIYSDDLNHNNKQMKRQPSIGSWAFSQTKFEEIENTMYQTEFNMGSYNMQQERAELLQILTAPGSILRLDYPTSWSHKVTETKERKTSFFGSFYKGFGLNPSKSVDNIGNSPENGNQAENINKTLTNVGIGSKIDSGYSILQTPQNTIYQQPQLNAAQNQNYNTLSNQNSNMNLTTHRSMTRKQSTQRLMPYHSPFRMNTSYQKREKELAEQLIPFWNDNKFLTLDLHPTQFLETVQIDPRFSFSHLSTEIKKCFIEELGVALRKLLTLTPLTVHIISPPPVGRQLETEFEELFGEKEKEQDKEKEKDKDKDNKENDGKTGEEQKEKQQKDENKQKIKLLTGKESDIQLLHLQKAIEMDLAKLSKNRFKQSQVERVQLDYALTKLGDANFIQQIKVASPIQTHKKDDLMKSSSQVFSSQNTLRNSLSQNTLKNSLSQNTLKNSLSKLNKMKIEEINIGEDLVKSNSQANLNQNSLRNSLTILTKMKMSEFNMGDGTLSEELTNQIMKIEDIRDISILVAAQRMAETQRKKSLEKAMFDISPTLFTSFLRLPPVSAPYSSALVEQTFVSLSHAAQPLLQEVLCFQDAGLLFYHPILLIALRAITRKILNDTYDANSPTSPLSHSKQWLDHLKKRRKEQLTQQRESEEKRLVAKAAAEAEQQQAQIQAGILNASSAKKILTPEAAAEQAKRLWADDNKTPPYIFPIRGTVNQPKTNQNDGNQNLSHLFNIDDEVGMCLCDEWQYVLHLCDQFLLQLFDPTQSGSRIPQLESSMEGVLVAERERPRTRLTNKQTFYAVSPYVRSFVAESQSRGTKYILAQGDPSHYALFGGGINGTFEGTAAGSQIFTGALGFQSALNDSRTGFDGSSLFTNQRSQSVQDQRRNQSRNSYGLINHGQQSPSNSVQINRPLSATSAKITETFKNSPSLSDQKVQQQQTQQAQSRPNSRTSEQSIISRASLSGNNIPFGKTVFRHNSIASVNTISTCEEISTAYILGLLSDDAKEQLFNLSCGVRSIRPPPPPDGRFVRVTAEVMKSFNEKEKLNDTKMIGSLGNTVRINSPNNNGQEWISAGYTEEESRKQKAYNLIIQKCETLIKKLQNMWNFLRENTLSDNATVVDSNLIAVLRQKEINQGVDDREWQKQSAVTADKYNKVLQYEQRQQEVKQKAEIRRQQYNIYGRYYPGKEDRNAITGQKQIENYKQEIAERNRRMLESRSSSSKQRVRNTQSQLSQKRILTPEVDIQEKQQENQRQTPTVATRESIPQDSVELTALRQWSLYGPIEKSSTGQPFIFRTQSPQLHQTSDWNSVGYDSTRMKLASAPAFISKYSPAPTSKSISSHKQFKATQSRLDPALFLPNVLQQYVGSMEYGVSIPSSIDPLKSVAQERATSAESNKMYRGRKPEALQPSKHLKASMKMGQLKGSKGEGEETELDEMIRLGFIPPPRILVAQSIGATKTANTIVLTTRAQKIK